MTKSEILAFTRKKLKERRSKGEWWQKWLNYKP
jgi:hypothetical protein